MRKYLNLVARSLTYVMGVQSNASHVNMLGDEFLRCLHHLCFCFSQASLVEADFDVRLMLCTWMAFHG